MAASGAIILVLMLATLGVLVTGLVVMVRGGEANRKHSTKLMSYRVYLQAATVLALVCFLMK